MRSVWTPSRRECMKGRNIGTGLSQIYEGQNTEGLHMKTSRTATAMFTTILALGGRDCPRFG